MSRLKLAAVAATLAVGAGSWAAPAQAFVFAFTGAIPVVLNLDNLSISTQTDPATGFASMGWYNETGFHDPGNPNYFIERPGEILGLGYNDFFVFDISGLSGTFTSASLYMDLGGFNYARVLFGSYSGDIDSLEAGTGGVAAYDALGAGTRYGDRVFPHDEPPGFVTVTLNSAFLSDLNAAVAAGESRIVIGGASAVPEPGAWATTVVGLGGVGALLRKRRFARRDATA